ncbi:MAG: T9SS C-terminal target domain-containing protein, partial [Bacteroidota bacterium]
MKIIRYPTILLGLLLVAATLPAQHNFEWNNQGALVTVTAGADMYIWGDLHNEGATATQDNDGFMEVQGNLFSDNLFQQRGTGTVRIENNDVNVNERQFIEGSYAVRGGSSQIGTDDGSFFNLELANTQGAVHLVGGGNVADVRNTVDFNPAGAAGAPPVNRIVTHDTTTVP